MRYGYFSNLSADQIAYATQSSEGAFIVSRDGKYKVEIEILRENYEHCDEKMYIALKDDDKTNFFLGRISGLFSIKNQIFVKNLATKFEVKHYYFRGLREAVAMIKPEIIARILPSIQDFLYFPVISDRDLDRLLLRIPCGLGIDQDEQRKALSTILSSDSKSPPVIVNGSFGTGKTRLLAITTRCLVEQGRRRNKPVRVLICAHHQSSVDHYIEQYFGPMTKHEHHPWRVKLIRLTSKWYYNRNSQFQWYYKKRDKYVHLYQHISPDYFVVVTTFSTARSLSSIHDAGFFTHILLDEGSQTREPENIAPLCLAAPDTKIVLAGDSCQVSLK